MRRGISSQRMSEPFRLVLDVYMVTTLTSKGDKNEVKGSFARARFTSRLACRKSKFASRITKPTGKWKTCPADGSGFSNSEGFGFKDR